MADDSWVQFTDNGDGSAEFTVTTEDSDHKFSAVAKDGEAVVTYEESRSKWLGPIYVAEPRAPVARTLLTSDEMTEFLDEYGLTAARQET